MILIMNSQQFTADSTRTYRWTIYILDEKFFCIFTVATVPFPCLTHRVFHLNFYFVACWTNDIGWFIIIKNILWHDTTFTIEQKLSDESQFFSGFTVIGCCSPDAVCLVFSSHDEMTYVLNVCANKPTRA